MVSQDLSDACRERIDKRRFYREEIKLGRVIQYLGAIILFIFLSELIYVGISHGTPIVLTTVEASPFLTGILLLITGTVLISRASQSDLSIDEEAFLDVYGSLDYIERYLTKDKKEWYRKKASDKLSKIVKNIDEPTYRDLPIFWGALTKEQEENVLLFKQNFNERLLPSITKGYEEDLKKAFPIIEKFAKFLLNPTNSELIDLNNSMSQLKLVKTEHFSLVHFYERYPKSYVPSIIAAFVIIASVFSYICFKFWNVSIDTALIIGVTLFAGCIGLINLIKRK